MILSSRIYKLLIVLGLIYITLDVSAADKTNTKKEEKINIYPDEYSELDNSPYANISSEKNVKKFLEVSANNINKANVAILSKDTASAIKILRETEKYLNVLTSTPNIDNNNEYIELVKKVNQFFVKYQIDMGGDTPVASVWTKFDEALEKYNAKATPKPDNTNVVKQSQPSLGLLSYPESEQEYIQRSIDFLTQTKARRIFSKWLERSTKWFPMMKRIAEEEGMPQEIIYLSMTESGLNPSVISKASAVGLWQFMTETGKDYGLNKNSSYWLDERRDPEKATRAAMRFLRDLYRNLGDWHLALAAYNCGQGRVQRTILKSRMTNPSYWDIRKILPKETGNYVAQYLAAATIAMNPQAYGFRFDTLKLEPEYKYDTYVLKEPVSIKALNDCAGALNTDVIRELNPELVRAITPIDRSEYVLKIPAGSKQDFITKFSGLTSADKQPWVTHTVKKKETLASIVSKYKVSKADLCALNPIDGKDCKFTKGTELRIPIDFDTYNAINSNIAISNEEEEEKNFAKNDVLHTVKKGETLFSIARRYGLSIEEIRNFNNLNKDNESVYVGQKIAIAQTQKEEPVAAKVSNTRNLASAETKVSKKAVKETIRETPKEPVTKTIKHKVTKGETLSKIADDYGVTVASLRENNTLKKGKVKSGQIIKIVTEDLATTSKSGKRSKSESLATAKTRVHKVEKGENLSTIAAEYGVTEDQIEDLNSTLVKNGQIFAGTRLKIPGGESKGSYSSPKSAVNNLPKFYKVKKGENLALIASKFGLTTKQIKAKNKNIVGNKLQAGTSIRLQ